MNEHNGRSPHPAVRGSSARGPNKPRERAPSPGASPANSQAAASTACTGRATQHYEPATAPLLFDGSRGIAAGRAPRDEVDLRAVPPERRRQAWRGIKRLEPGLAALLRDDPFVAQLRQRLGATPMLRRDDYRRFLAAGEEGGCESEN